MGGGVIRRLAMGQGSQRSTARDAILAVPSAQLRFTSEFAMGRKVRSLGPEDEGNFV